jgi:LmbE family N-acetylglucosaminyl deacetylase
MLWIYLSPHFDDVALSCGGLVWEQVQAGDSVSIWTVCSGNAPGGELSPFAEELLLRWEADQDATAQRRLEDIHSCQRLGSGNCYFGIPDCIYRRHPQTGEFLYASETALTGLLQPADTQSIMSLREDLKRSIQADMVLVCPLGLGNHVDHQLTRLAAEGLDCTLWYYADYPYVLRCMEQLDKMEQDGWSRQIFPISLKGLIAWQDSIAAHGSQISTFWSNETEMRQAIVDYLSWNHGIQLWRKSGP